MQRCVDRSNYFEERKELLRSSTENFRREGRPDRLIEPELVSLRQTVPMPIDTATVPGRQRPRVIAHRGASSTHQENTLDAFRAAGELGADGIELDVRRSADNVLVIHHDAQLSDGRLIYELNADQLPSYVPTLVEALDASGDLWVNIEIKNHPGDADYDEEMGISLGVAALVSAFDIAGRVLISSFDFESVLRIREVDGSIPIGWLVWGQANPAMLIARAKAHNFDAIHPHDAMVDASFVRMAHEANLAVNVWTVDDPSRIEALTKLGVDGIVTNSPAVGAKAVAEALS